MHELLNSERFCDLAPRQVYGILLDEGAYYCSVSTMYRILNEYGEAKERRRQRVHPHYTRPELLATGPNQVWSWDITWLKGPFKWQFFYLYVILDIFSRYVTGWMVAEQESGELAQQLIVETYRTQAIQPEQLTLHADRGAPMKSQTVAQLLVSLEVAKSHSRPYTSNDNPFSEAHFKTLKYNPWFPGKFGTIDEGLAFGKHFFGWYNNEHHHSGLAFLTPADVHHGRVEEVLVERDRALADAFAAHPERFVNGPPMAKRPPTEVYINPPPGAADGDDVARVHTPAENEDSPSMAPLDAAASTEARVH